MIVKAKASILILPKFKPKMCFFSLDDIELLDWTTTNKFSRLWFCEDIHHSSILKQAIKKAIHKFNNWNLTSKSFEDDSNNETNQFVGFVSSHKRAHSWHPSIFTALLISILICRRGQLWLALLHHRITLCQVCRINYSSLCNWHNIVMCHCFPPSSPTTLLEKMFA